MSLWHNEEIVNEDPPTLTRGFHDARIPRRRPTILPSHPTITTYHHRSVPSLSRCRATVPSRRIQNTLNRYTQKIFFTIFFFRPQVILNFFEVLSNFNGYFFEITLARFAYFFELSNVSKASEIFSAVILKRFYELFKVLESLWKI